MNKERIFYLDFIRAVATILILMTHFNAVFLYAGMPEKVFITSSIANLYIGDFGVSLFFIISGASLMYVYDEQCSLKKFYKRRFLSIYPMFWIAYLIAFLYQFYQMQGINQNIPKINILYTVFGFDGYFSAYIPTFYILGEWFLGCIILMYFIFPLMRFGLKKNVAVTVGLTVLFYFIFMFCNIPFNKTEIIFVRLPEILFGMLFIKYRKKVKWPVALGALIVLILNGILKPELDCNYQTTYIGIAAFLLLVFVSQYLRSNFIYRVSAVISKYSYAVFLVHHVIIMQILYKFDLNNVSRFYSCLLFLLCCCVIALFAKLLYMLHSAVMKEITLWKGLLPSEKERDKIQNRNKRGECI